MSCEFLCQVFLAGSTGKGVNEVWWFSFNQSRILRETGKKWSCLDYFWVILLWMSWYWLFITSNRLPSLQKAGWPDFCCNFLEKSRCVSERADNRLKNHVKTMVGKLRSAFCLPEKETCCCCTRASLKRQAVFGRRDPQAKDVLLKLSGWVSCSAGLRAWFRLGASFTQKKYPQEDVPQSHGSAGGLIDAFNYWDDAYWRSKALAALSSGIMSKGVTNHQDYFGELQVTEINQQ